MQNEFYNSPMDHLGIFIRIYHYIKSHLKGEKMSRFRFSGSGCLHFWVWFSLKGWNGGYFVFVCVFKFFILSPLYVYIFFYSFIFFSWGRACFGVFGFVLGGFIFCYCFSFNRCCIRFIMKAMKFHLLIVIMFSFFSPNKTVVFFLSHPLYWLCL